MMNDWGNFLFYITRFVTQNDSSIYRKQSENTLFTFLSIEAILLMKPIQKNIYRIALDYSPVMCIYMKLIC